MDYLSAINKIIADALRQGASDVHIVAGTPVTFRIDGVLKNYTDDVLTSEDCEGFGRVLSEDYDSLSKTGDQDTAFSFECGCRCRINLFKQQGCTSAAIRLLNENIPDFDALGLPPEAKKFIEFNNGLVLITGETGSGKSTTIASLLNIINKTQHKHIITLEDPVEYVFKRDKCVINQREVGRDTKNYTDGLKALLRQDPDIIMIGEMRFLETIETALLAAETGHLVFATLHTNSAGDSIDRIIDVFPELQQRQIRLRLSMTLQAVMCQQLLPRANTKGRVVATELMFVNGGIRNMIREAKTPQISSAIQTNAALGSHIMDSCLIKLAKDRKITNETATSCAADSEFVSRQLLFI